MRTLILIPLLVLGACDFRKNPAEGKTKPVKNGSQDGRSIKGVRCDEDWVTKNVTGEFGLSIEADGFTLTLPQEGTIHILFREGSKVRSRIEKRVRKGRVTVAYAAHQLEGLALRDMLPRDRRVHIDKALPEISIWSLTFLKLFMTARTKRERFQSTSRILLLVHPDFDLDVKVADLLRKRQPTGFAWGKEHRLVTWKPILNDPQEEESSLALGKQEPWSLSFRFDPSR